MLRTFAIVLIVLWIFGLISPLAVGGLLHTLLVIAVILLLVDFISGRGRG